MGGLLTTVEPGRWRSSLGYSFAAGSIAMPFQQRWRSRKKVFEVKTPSPAPTSTKYPCNMNMIFTIRLQAAI